MVLTNHLDMPLLLRDVVPLCRALQQTLVTSDPLGARRQLLATEQILWQLGDRKAYLLCAIQRQHPAKITVARTTSIDPVYTKD